MRVGIVGAESAKFTSLGQYRARVLIRELLLRPGVVAVVSGHCHLGGIDIWAEEEADDLGVAKAIFPPATLAWESGFKPRNIQIAEDATELHNIVVDSYPLEFRGRRFDLCYHCNARDHIKSGGCWTAKYAQRLGKPATWHTVPNDL